MATEGSAGGNGGHHRMNPGNFAHDRTRAVEAGRLGGQRQGKATNPGNFANDRAKAAEAGRKGGQHRGGAGGGQRSGHAGRPFPPGDPLLD